MKNRKNITVNQDIKIILTLFSFQEEIYQKISLSNYETPRNSKIEDNSAVFIKKSIMEKYKKFYNYEILYKFLKSKKNILDCIKDNKIINTEKLKSRKILDEIIFQLPDDFIKKINNINENNNDLFSILECQGIKLGKVLLGNYIIGNQKIFIIFKDSDIFCYELGQIKEDGKFIIEYLFNTKEISYSKFFY